MGLFGCTHNFIQILDEKGKPTIKKKEHPPMYEGDHHLTVIYTVLFCTRCGQERTMQIKRTKKKGIYVEEK